jgi:hypothetical protein
MAKNQVLVNQDMAGIGVTPRIIGGLINPAATSSQAIPVKVNSTGELVTGISDDVTSVTAPYYSLAKVSGSIVKASGGFLRSVHGFNSGSAQFIQIHNLATQPLNGSIPVNVFIAAALSNFSIDFGATGLPLTAGIFIGNSSTPDVLTSGSEDLLFTAIYK